jgi:hypothetical protein
MYVFAEPCKVGTRTEPHRFWGIQRNGREWAFTCREFVDAVVGWRVTESVSLFNKEDHEMSDESINVVAFMLFQIFSDIKIQIAKIDLCTSALTEAFVEDGSGSNNESYDNGDDNVSDPGKNHPSSHQPKANTGGAGANTSVGTGALKLSSAQGRGSNKGGGTKRLALASLPLHKILNAQNLACHDNFIRT